MIDDKNLSSSTDDHTFPTETEDFESLLASFDKNAHSLNVGDIVKGKILSIKDNYVLVDIDYKSEGKIPLEQIRDVEDFDMLQKGSVIEAVIENLEDDDGYVILSYEKVSNQKYYDKLEELFKKGETLTGNVISTVKGGLTVDIGVKAFLPGSQIDFHPIRDFNSLIGKDFELKILQYNKLRRNIVVSRKAVLLEKINEIRAKTMSKLVPGQIVEGVVKNITDYGVFLDLGGIDGLLHKTDISWGRVHHPADFFQLGDRIKVMVLHFDPNEMKVSLGYKQLEPDPWKHASEKYKTGTIVEGKIVNTAPYGLFVELEKGIEGLVHKSEVAWNTNKKIQFHNFQPGTPVKVMVLHIDTQSRRLSLSIKRTTKNPWEDFCNRYSCGSIVEGTISNITHHGIFVEVEPDIIGLVHQSDITWKNRTENPLMLYKKGQRVKSVILDIRPHQQRLTLGLKQLEDDIWDDFFSVHQLGDLIEGTITRVVDFGVFVQLTDGIEGLCHINEMGDLKGKSPKDIFTPNQKVKMMIIKMNLAEKKIGLSYDRKKPAIWEHGSTEMSGEPSTIDEEPKKEIIH